MKKIPVKSRIIANTKIEWADNTFNPWIGCTKVSPACDFCYAEELMDTRYGRVEWGGDRVRTAAANWKQPLAWNRRAAAAGKTETVFCLSLGDIWDNQVDSVWRRDLFALIEATPSLTWLLLSKRIGNAGAMCDPAGGNPCLPRNAALGATMINQPEWDRDMPKLREAGRVLGARFTFASVEPMLGEIDARGNLPDWVIVGGESGHHARPMRPAWARSMRDQCAAAGVPFLFKQWGEWTPGENVDRRRGTVPVAHWWDDTWLFDRENLARTDGHRDDEPDLYRVGKTEAGRSLDGRTWDGIPFLPRSAETA